MATTKIQLTKLPQILGDRTTRYITKDGVTLTYNQVLEDWKLYEVEGMTLETLKERGQKHNRSKSSKSTSRSNVGSKSGWVYDGFISSHTKQANERGFAMVELVNRVNEVTCEAMC